MKNCVYRFLNKDNEVIYIGKAKDLKQRLSSHNHLPKECYDERTCVEYIKFKTEDDMNFAERYFILKCNPKYNTILANKDFNLNSIELNVKKWNIYIGNKTQDKEVEESNVDLADLIEELKEIDTKIKTLDELRTNALKDLGFISGIWEVYGKAQERQVELIHQIQILSIKEGVPSWLREEYKKYYVWHKEDLVRKKVEEMECKYIDICKKEIEEHGYYKEEIYELIDREFICKGGNHHRWKTLIDGRNTDWGETEIYRIDEELKNKIISQIIKNIEKHISMEYGELERDIVILDSFSEIETESYPDYNYMKFKKPFIVYKIKQVA